MLLFHIHHFIQIIFREVSKHGEFHLIGGVGLSGDHLLAALLEIGEVESTPSFIHFYHYLLYSSQSPSHFTGYTPR